MPRSPQPAHAPDPGAFTHRERVTILFGLMLGTFLAALDQTIIATALPRIAADLQGVEHLSWVVSSYLLTSTAATPIYGKLSDLYGRKAMLQVAIAIFLATSVLCGMAATMTQLIAFRALQGLGGGGLIAMAHATIADVISPRERGRYQAYIAATFAVASVGGPVLGGVFADHLTWRWVFWINLPIGVGALVMAQLTLGRLVAKRIHHRIDYLGAVLIVSAVCCVLLAITMGGNEVPWNSPPIWFLAVGALVCFALAIVQERNASEPILPPRLFANRIFVFASFTNLFISVAMLGAIVFLPLFFQLVRGLNADTSGLMLIPFTAFTVVGAVSTGRLVAATGRTKIFPLIGVALSFVGMMLFAGIDPATPLWQVGPLMALTGFGMGLVMPVMIVVVQNAVEPGDLGTATASISFFRSMGGAVGVALFAAVLIARLDTLVGGALGPDAGIKLLHAGAQALDLVPPALRSTVGAAMATAFRDMFHVAAGVLVLTFLCVLAVKELPLKTISGSAERAAGKPPGSS